MIPLVLDLTNTYNEIVQFVTVSCRFLHAYLFYNSYHILSSLCTYISVDKFACSLH